MSKNSLPAGGRRVDDASDVLEIGPNASYLV